MDSVTQGDAFDLVAQLEVRSVDLVLTSPPYWGLRSYGLDHNEGTLEQWESLGCDRARVPNWDWYKGAGGVLGLEPLPEWYVGHLVEIFNRMRPALKQSGSLWINLGDTYFARWSSIRKNGRQGIDGDRTRRRTPSGGYLHDKQLLMIPARFAIAMQDAGWILRNDLIWSKPHPMPRPERDRLRLSHEHWFHFVLRNPKGRPSYYYNRDESESGALDVVSHETSNGANGHSARFPERVVEPRIRSTCPPGGLVVDPFCGIGTSLTVAQRLNRRFVGFEISEEYAALAKESLDSLHPEPARHLESPQRDRGNRGG